MIKIMKFKRSDGSFKTQSPSDGWKTHSGIHYTCYPFIIHKSLRHWDKKYSLTHMASGTQICKVRYLKVAKYIATRLSPITQFLLPHRKLVDYMSEDEKTYCRNVMARYMDAKSKDLELLDRICPYSI